MKKSSAIFNHDWKNSPKFGENLKNEFGREFSKLNSAQKKLIESGDSEKWDISLFFKIFNLNNFDETVLSKEIIKIKDIRNELAHNSNFFIAYKEYTDKTNVLFQCMRNLGMVDKKINELQVSLRPVPNNKNEIQEDENSKHFTKIKEEGNNHFKKKLFDEAIKNYDKALEFQGIKISERALVYSNKSVSYYEKYKLSNNKEDLEESKQSAKLGIIADPMYMKNYYRISLVFEENKKYEKALCYLNKCLGLDPSNNTVKQKVEEIKYSQLSNKLEDHLNPDLFPRTYEEINENALVYLSERLGKNLNIDLLNHGELNPFNKDVVEGHKYRHGTLNLPVNLSEAAKYYAKAAHSGDPEGMYNLADLSLNGNGVKKDIKEAIALFEKAADISPKIKIMGKEFENFGVKESQHMLGLIYQNGVYYEKNILKAIEFYEKAIQNRNGYSANNLGILYYHGDGVEQNLDKAEKLYILAISLNDPNALFNIANLYLKKFDPIKALQFHERAIEKMYFKSIKNDKEIRKTIRLMIDDFENSGVEEWEKSNKISFENLSYGERIKRFANQSNYLNNYIIDLANKFDYSNFKFISNKYDPIKLEETAKKGSLTALKMVRCIQNIIKIRDILETKNNNFTEDEKFKIIDYCFNSIEAEHSICQFISIKKDILLPIAEQIIKQNSNKETEIDKKARICMIYLNFNDYYNNSIYCDQCIKKYPGYYLFYYFKGSMLCFLNSYEMSISIYDKGLECNPNYVDLLYNKSAALRIINSKNTKSAYEKFLLYCEKDDRKYPEAFYGIAVYCFINGQYEDMQKFYDLGLESEKNQLCCYLPYLSTSKEVVEKNIKINYSITNSTKFFEKDIQEFEKDFLRLDLIKDNRGSINNYFKYKGCKVIKSSIPRQKLIKQSFNNLKKTYFRDIDTTYDHILKGFYLEIIIIDLLYFTQSSHMTVIEDQNRDVQRIAIYGLEDNSDTKYKFKVGTILKIMNPYMRLAADNLPMIRIDDLNSIEILRNVEKPCLVCMKENSELNCRKCKKANYCSKNCLSVDQDYLEHKLICKKAFN